jgi:hypothetical protein
MAVLIKIYQGRRTRNLLAVSPYHLPPLCMIFMLFSISEIADFLYRGAQLIDFWSTGTSRREVRRIRTMIDSMED